MVIWGERLTDSGRRHLSCKLYRLSCGNDCRDIWKIPQLEIVSSILTGLVTFYCSGSRSGGKRDGVCATVAENNAIKVVVSRHMVLEIQRPDHRSPGGKFYQAG